MLGAHLTLTYYVRSFEDMKAILSDPEYQARGRETEVGWIDTSKGQVKVGWETIYLENGEVVNTVAGDWSLENYAITVCV